MMVQGEGDGCGDHNMVIQMGGGDCGQGANLWADLRELIDQVGLALGLGLGLELDAGSGESEEILSRGT